MTKQSSKIKIIRIISRMNIGGPSKHVVNLTEGLNKLGFETLLISGHPEKSEGDFFDLAIQKNIILKTINIMERPISPIKDFLSFMKIYKEIKVFSPTIVHTHTTKAGILGRLAALLCGVKHIYHTYHGYIFSGYFSKFNSILIAGIERIFASFTTRLITLTPNLAKELKQRLKIKDENKIVTIPLGLDLEKNLSTPRKLGKWRQAMNLSTNDFIIGIVARLVPVKNHQKLILAFSELYKTYPNIHLAIIGDGELHSHLKQLSDKLKLNKIHFCGILKNLEEVYSDLDLLVICSKNEGTPVTIIEALASGCPVASTNVGGVSEVLENGRIGRLLPSEQSEFTRSLSVVISDIMEDRFKEMPNLDIREKTCETYSVDRLVQNIYKLYCE